MIANILQLVALLVLTAAARLAYSFYWNLQACRASGIPYVCIPFQTHGILPQLLYPLWHPLLALLPKSVKGKWYIFMQASLPWDELYAPFRQAGSDSVLTCAPLEILLHTCSAEVISQLTERRNDFPKPTHIYSIIDIYGKSAISVEGQLWKKHRKVTAGPFTERNNHVVWSEAIQQSQQMMSHVFPGLSSSSVSIEDLEALSSRTALAIISKAGFGVSMDWPKPDDVSIPNYDERSDQQSARLDADWVQGKTNGHQMPYADAIFSVSTDVFWLFVFRRSLLKYFPFASARRVSQAYIDWGQYMREMVAAKRQELDDSPDAKPPGTDLLASLVKSARDTQTFVEDSTTNSGKIGVDGFSDDEIMGNAFLLIMAGHETTAGVLHTALLLLAMNVDSQRHLQREVDDIFGSRAPSEWEYERDFPRAFNGMIGAVMSETLRWMPPVPAIPKITLCQQPLVVKGAQCTVPERTRIALHTPASHRNPNQWPHDPPKRPNELEYAPSNTDDDLGEFRPERWLLQSKSDRSLADSTEEARQEQSDEQAQRYASGTAPGLYRPPRGAYLPFSEGARACLGRRFSQVETVAMLAVIFQRYSVELATDEWAGDTEVAAMDEKQREKLWRTARASAQLKFRTKMKTLMTNRMTGAHVPIRFVKKGEERFAAEKWIN